MKKSGHWKTRAGNDVMMRALAGITVVLTLCEHNLLSEDSVHIQNDVFISIIFKLLV